LKRAKRTAPSTRLEGSAAAPAAPSQGVAHGPAVSPWKVPPAVLIVSIVLLGGSLLPALAGRLAAADDEVFLGFRHMARDHFQYASLVRQTAEEGRFLLENRFTTEPQRPSYILLYLWLVGIVCRFTGMDVVTGWEVMKLVVGLIFLLVAWRFTALFWQRQQDRFLAWTFIALSGGLAWVLYLAGYRPTAGGLPWLKDPFDNQWNWCTARAMLLPEWIAPLTLVLACVLLLSRESRGARLRDPLHWAAGLLLGPAIWFTHPHTGNATYLGFAIYTIVPALSALWRLRAPDRKELREAVADVAPLLASALVIAFYILWARQDFVYRETSEHAKLWSPAYTVFWYPVTYGLLLPLGFLGMRWSGSLPERPRRVLFSLMAAAFILSTNPLMSGVKHQFLIHPFLAILAAHGLLELRHRSPAAARLTRGAWALVFSGALFLTWPLTLVDDFLRPRIESDAFMLDAELAAMQFLDTQPPGSTLCMNLTGGRIPWLSRKTVFHGHWFMTIKENDKIRETTAFFSAKLHPEIKKRWLVENKIRYVYYGPGEQATGDVDAGIGLQMIWNSGGVQIFQVP
jgi:hypothetical protein